MADPRPHETGTAPSGEVACSFPPMARLLGCLCALAGATGLLGWVVDNEAIRRIVPSLPEMQPNTALGLAVCGISLALGRKRDVMARVLAAFAAAIGILTTLEYVLAVDLGADDLFLTGTQRMAPQTALALWGTGAALYARRTERALGLVPGLAMVPISLAYVSLVGMLFDAKMPIEQLTALMGCSLPPGHEIASCVDEHVRPYFQEFLERGGRAPARAAVAANVGHGTLRFLRFCAIPVRDDVDGILLVVRDDTSRRLAEDALRSRTRALEFATRDLETFAVLASHDLKEPLRKIQLHADRISAMPGLDGAASDGLARIRSVAAVLQQRVSDLLAYSRAAVSVQITENVDLGRLVADVVREYGARLDDAGARVVLDPLPVMNVDPARLRDVFRNLLDNALKFRRPGVPLVVAVRARPLTGDEFELTVEDNGMGFDEDDRERIFAVFRTLQPRERYPGTGIGLALCRRIVELHGGEIEAHGRTGEGAAFRIRLPIHAARGTHAECKPMPEPA